MGQKLIGIFFRGELMIPDEEQPKRKMEIFEIGVYAIEAGIVAAIVYAMFAFPMWLKTAAT